MHHVTVAASSVLPRNKVREKYEGRAKLFIMWCLRDCEYLSYLKVLKIHLQMKSGNG